MPEFSQDTYAGYSVECDPEAKGNNRCRGLAAVGHLTHVRIDCDIVDAGQITLQLIYDDSRLNTERLLVVWLSPNDWTNAGGFRYGNVTFELDWPALIAGKRLYWVGAMDHNPTACRVLITDRDRDKQLLPYDPTAGNGPWWHDVKSDRHYWNGDYCLESCSNKTCHYPR